MNFKPCRFLAVFTLVMTLWCSAAEAYVGDLIVYVTRSDGSSSLAGMKVKLVNEYYNQEYTAETDASGRVVFPNLEDYYSYTLSFDPEGSYNFYQNGKFKKPVPQTLTFNFFQDDTYEHTEALQITPRRISIRMFESGELDKPVANLPVAFEDLSSFERPLVRTTTDEFGRAYAPISFTDSGAYKITSEPSNYTNVFILDTLIAGTSSVEHIASVYEVNTTVMARLFSANNTLFNVPNNATARIRCKSPTGGIYGVDITPGKSSMPLKISSNISSYQCACLLGQGFLVGDLTVSNITSADSGIDFKVYPVDKSLRLSFKDKDSGNIITDQTFRATLIPEIPTAKGVSSGLPMRGDFINGVMTPIPVASGVKYKPLLENITSGEHKYLIPIKELGSITITNNNPTINVDAVKFDAKLSVAVNLPEDDLSGAKVNGIVSISASRAAMSARLGITDMQGGVEIFRRPLVDGKMEINLLSGISYQVSFATNSQEYMTPASETVLPKVNENMNISLTLQKPNHTIKVTPIIKNQSGNRLLSKNASFISCAARRSDGAMSFSTELISDSYLELPIQRSGSNIIGLSCSAIFTGDPGSIHLGRLSHRLTNGSNSEAEIELIFVNPHYPERTESFEPAEQSRVILPDGKSFLDITAGAFGSGTVGKLLIKSPEGLPASNTTVALISYDIKPLVDGEIVSGTSESVRFCIPTTKEELAGYQLLYGSGITMESLKIAYLNKDTGRWEQVKTTVEDGQICADLEHFSIWGKIIEVIEELQKSAPNNFKIARNLNSKGKMLLSWSSPQGIEVNGDVNYRVSYNTRVKNSKKCRQLTESQFTRSKAVAKNKIGIKSHRLCARVAVDGGTATLPRYRKPTL